MRGTHPPQQAEGLPRMAVRQAFSLLSNEGRPSRGLRFGSTLGYFAWALSARFYAI
jgi:hypothetical protein